MSQDLSVPGLNSRVDALLTRHDYFTAWLAGTATGGPAQNGRYPLLMTTGLTLDLLCPAALEAQFAGPATQVSQQAAAAAASATAAASSATAAAGSATSASSAATSAASSATAAGNSQTSATASATAAANSATAAAGSATSASGSATNAANSATSANTARVAAETARDQAQSAAASVPGPSNATPQALGVAAPGSASAVSRADHVHPIPTPDLVGARRLNMVINGGMQIDQRNNGASVSIINSFICDRFLTTSNFGSVNGQRIAGGAGGASHLLRITNNSVASPPAGGFQGIFYRIEGLDSARLFWGSPSARAVTLRFRARSSVSGRFGGCIRNSAGDRNFGFSFDIPSPNTWVDVRISIPGDTSGTWLTSNGIGVQILWGISTGANFRHPSNVWGSNVAVSPSDAVNLSSTSGATFDLTAVQFEEGSAGEFMQNTYADDLALCRRYFQRIGGLAPFEVMGTGYVNGGAAELAFTHSPQMRTAPILSVGSATAFGVNDGSVAVNSTSVNLSGAINNTELVSLVLISASGVTNGRGCRVYAANSLLATLSFSAEL